MAVLEKQVVKEFMPVVVSEVVTSQYQKAGTKTAILRQTIHQKATYPSVHIGNNKSDMLFAEDAFTLPTKEFEDTRTRVAFINVPDNVTVEEVQEHLKSCPEATLYRELSNRPILTDMQEQALQMAYERDGKVGKQTLMDTYADKQVLRYPADYEEEAKRGKLILDKNNKPQYQATFFSKTKKEDVDKRTEAKDDYMASPTILSELQQMLQQAFSPVMEVQEAVQTLPF